MKNIIIKIPRAGASAQFILRPTAASGQVVIVASDDVEIQLSESPAATTTVPKSLTTADPDKTTDAKPRADLDAILKRLRKLKPTKRSAAVNSIKAMFQFDRPINDEEADKILERLRRRGSLTIQANGKLQFCKA